MISFRGQARQETWHDFFSRGQPARRHGLIFFSRLAARAEAAGLQNRHGPSLRLGSFLIRKCSETQ